MSPNVPPWRCGPDGTLPIPPLSTGPAPAVACQARRAPRAARSRPMSLTSRFGIRHSALGIFDKRLICRMGSHISRPQSHFTPALAIRRSPPPRETTAGRRTDCLISLPPAPPSRAHGHLAHRPTVALRLPASHAPRLARDAAPIHTQCLIRRSEAVTRRDTDERQWAIPHPPPHFCRAESRSIQMHKYVKSYSTQVYINHANLSLRDTRFSHTPTP
jgi:hypothetical protein